MNDYSRPAAPDDADIRHDDLEFDPTIEPQESHAWLNLLKESEKTFEDWNMHCDKIDKRYANLDRLSTNGRDREFQMFWANIEVIGPSIYATPPAPVVAPKWKDRRPVPQAASEVLERCISATFDQCHIDELMKLVRDDVALIGRGVAWCRYEPKSDTHDYECVCIDFKHRRDFLHSVSRNWREVTWVAGASYLTRAEARDRFYSTSGNCYKEADYKVDRDIKEVGGTDNRERAKFWEIWDRPNRRVVWVAEGCEKILDEDDPHLDFTDFFPCPRPAYGTLQRGSLVPVPDVLQYEDQLDEINVLTAKIHALSVALEAKGFYPAGGAELSEAIQAAIATNTPGRMLVPISNWAAFGGSKEVIVWLPIDVIAQTIQQAVTLRQQIIQDIYQIMGLSDIMRGATDPSETLGAQQLKTQYGSARIRDKQEALVRIARDLVNITAEIITENFDEVTIIKMSQTQLPTKKMQEKQANELAQQIRQQEQQLAQAQQMLQQQQQPPPPPPGLPPGAVPVGPPNGAAPAGPPGASPPSPGGAPGVPGDPQQALQQAQSIIDEGHKALKAVLEKPTFDQVMTLFRDSRTKCFTLDIETDSTIQTDENAEKQRRSEFTAVLAQLLPQLAQMIALEPQTGAFCSEVLKFTVAPYRAGRSLDGSIDDLAELMKHKAEAPKGEDPATMQARTAKEIEAMKIAHAQQKDQMEAELKKQEMQMRDGHEQAKIASNEKIKQAELQARQGDEQAKAQTLQLKAIADREKHQLDVEKQRGDLQMGAVKIDHAKQLAQLKLQQTAAQGEQKRAAEQFKLQQAAMRPPPAGRPGL
jgi:hypothetical protein